MQVLNALQFFSSLQLFVGLATVMESYLREEFPSSEIRSDSQNKSIDETISIVRSYLR